MPPLIAGMGGGLSHQRIRCISPLRLRLAPQSACALAIDVEQSPFAFARAERWPSGRRHQIANLAYWVTGTEGSNPSLSAIQPVLFAYILEGDRHATCSFLQGPRDIASLGRCASGAAVTASPRRSARRLQVSAHLPA